MVGNTRVHASHCVHHHQGVFICMLCGSIGTRKFQKLAMPCQKYCSAYAEKAKQRFFNGKHPQRGCEWPDPFSRLPSGLIWSPSGRD